MSLTALKSSRSQTIERDDAAAALSPEQGLVDAVSEQYPVREPGQRIVRRLIGKLGLSFPQLTYGRLQTACQPRVLHDGEQLADEDERDGDGSCRDEQHVEPAARHRPRYGDPDRNAERHVGKHGLACGELSSRTLGAVRCDRRKRRQEDQQIPTM